VEREIASENIRLLAIDRDVLTCLESDFDRAEHEQEVSDVVFDWVSTYYNKAGILNSLGPMYATVSKFLGSPRVLLKYRLVLLIALANTAADTSTKPSRGFAVLG
jgi:hypothetical protein